jgi:hypothetical protein
MKLRAPWHSGGPLQGPTRTDVRIAAPPTDYLMKSASRLAPPTQVKFVTRRRRPAGAESAAPSPCLPSLLAIDCPAARAPTLRTLTGTRTMEALAAITRSLALSALAGTAAHVELFPPFSLDALYSTSWAVLRQRFAGTVSFAGMTAGGTRTPVPYFSMVRVFMLYTSPAERT